MTRHALVMAVSMSMAALSCGYHVGGGADLIPKGIQSISIPRFYTLSTRYKLIDMLPQEIGREFGSRTRFHIVNDPRAADAVLNGTINMVTIAPTVFDPTSLKATSVQINVLLTINLVERTTGRVLYSRANWGFRQNYDIAVDPHQFFDESGPALDRVSRDIAHDVVSSVVENF